VAVAANIKVQAGVERPTMQILVVVAYIK